MKFRRINEDTVRCIVSKEDMQEYGIVLEDFFKNKGKLHEFLHEVVEKAEQEVGYEPKEGLLSMQIMPISQNTISITFTEQGNGSYEGMLDDIKDSVAEILSEEEGTLTVEDILDDEDDYEDEDNDDDENEEFKSDKSSEENKKNTIVVGMEKSSTIMIAMQSIEKIADFCRMLNIDKTVNSELYRLDNRNMYCLIIEKKRLSSVLMRRILLLAVEFTSHITDEMKIIAYVREHGENVIEKSAYRILKTYI